MRMLVTGASGAIGAELVPHLAREGHELRALARTPARVPEPVAALAEVVQGDAVTGAGLDAALDGADVAFFLIHSMESVSAAGADTGFAGRDRAAATAFAEAAARAGVRRVVYLGGLVPATGRASEHLASRLEVEDILLSAAPEAVALRASIVIGARSRSFRFLVRLVERVPVMPLPAWRDNRTQPIDGRDVLAYLAAAASSDAVHGAGGSVSVDIAGPDVLTYGELVDRIRDALLVGRPALSLPITLTPVASRVAAAIAGEDHELIGPLMAGLEGDLLPRDDRAQALFGVRLHRLDAAIERALREWEATEEVAAR